MHKYILHLLSSFQLISDYHLLGPNKTSFSEFSIPFSPSILIVGKKFRERCLRTVNGLKICRDTFLVTFDLFKTIVKTYILLPPPHTTNPCTHQLLLTFGMLFRKANGLIFIHLLTLPFPSRSLSRPKLRTFERLTVVITGSHSTSIRLKIPVERPLLPKIYIF